MLCALVVRTASAVSHGAPTLTPVLVGERLKNKLPPIASTRPTQPTATGDHAAEAQDHIHLWHQRLVHGEEEQRGGPICSVVGRGNTRQHSNHHHPDFLQWWWWGVHDHLPFNDPRMVSLRNATQGSLKEKAARACLSRCFLPI